MNVLFVYYVPSGGVETLNRQRCRALRNYGIRGHCLYFSDGAGLQNHPSDLPVVVTSNDIVIKQMIDRNNYQAIVIVSDYKSLKKFRLLGYTGKLILEIQGYGPKAVAREELQKAIPYVSNFAAAVLHPNTPHIEVLFREFYPSTSQFHFNNCFNAQDFTYIQTSKASHPIVAWVGRIEDNKNWREFLLIGNHLIRYYNPNLQLYMFEDPSLSSTNERIQFMSMIEELNLRNNLTLLANVPNIDMQRYLSYIGDSGGFLCSTSKVEGAPYAILEAMSCRCPVLTTDSDGVSSSIYHNITGKYYRLGDIVHAYNEATELMTAAGLRESVRTNAQAYVQVQFAPDTYCNHFIGMLQSI